MERFMKVVVSTFGKWEKERQEFVKALLSNPQIAEKCTQKQIEDAIFDQVHSKMFELGYRFGTENPYELEELQERTIVSYNLTLAAPIAKILSETLNIDQKILEPYVNNFRKAARDSIPDIIGDSLRIGNESQKIKKETIDKLYGAEFATKYPQIYGELLSADMDAVKAAGEAIEKFIADDNNKFNDKELVLKQFIYISECIKQLPSKPEFEKRFLETTGKTMADYKDWYRKSQKTEEVQSLPTPSIKDEKGANRNLLWQREEPNDTQGHTPTSSFQQ